MIGKVISYTKGTYVIKFTVPGYIEEGEAIPLNTWDRPDKDDEIYILQDESLYGGLYCYVKLGSRDENIHEIQTDKFEVRLDENKEVINIKFNDKFKLDIDLSNNKIGLEFKDAEFTIDTKKIHLGKSDLEPAILGKKFEAHMKALYSALASHTHGSSQGPTTAPLPPSLMKFKVELPNKLKELLSKTVNLMK